MARERIRSPIVVERARQIVDGYATLKVTLRQVMYRLAAALPWHDGSAMADLVMQQMPDDQQRLLVLRIQARQSAQRKATA